MIPQLLIVEDDRHLLSLLIDHFSHKFKIKSTDSVESACDLADENEFDVAIIDRVLTDGDGIDVMSYLRDVQPKTRVIALSRMSTAIQRVNGLEAGADDYLIKPVCLAELTIKLNKQLNTTKGVTQTKIIRSKTLALNFLTSELKLGSKTIRLRKRESQIFSVLLQYINQVVTRQMIIDVVWGQGNFVPSKTTLDVYIRRLRMHLGNSPGKIVTLKGVGYSYQE